MLTRKTTQMMFLLTAVVCGAAVVMSLKDDPTIPCPLWLAVTLRVVAMLSVGLATVMMLRMLIRAGRIRVDPGDKLIRVSVGIAHCFFAYSLYGVITMAERIKLEGITFRTPFMVFFSGASVFYFWKLTGIFERMLARAPHGMLKLTLVDTAAYPGHFSADLSSPTKHPDIAIPPDEIVPR